MNDASAFTRKAPTDYDLFFGEEEGDRELYGDDDDDDDGSYDDWQVGSDASFSRKYDIFTDALQVFSYVTPRPTPDRPLKPRPSKQADRKNIGSRLQQVKAYTSAVERLALWWERDELERKSKLAANRILFSRTYMSACVLCYRKSQKKKFVTHWKTVVEEARRGLDTLFTTPGVANTRREGLMFGIYDHIYVSSNFRWWRSLSDLFGRGARAMVQAENRIFRATLFRRWKLVMQVFHALERIMNDWQYSRSFGAVRQWRGFVKIHRAGTSFVHRIFRVVRRRKIAEGWKQWQSADAYWLEEFERRKAKLASCLKDYKGKLIAWTLKQFRVATGVGFWNARPDKALPGGHETDPEQDAVGENGEGASEYDDVDANVDGDDDNDDVDDFEEGGDQYGAQDAVDNRPSSDSNPEASRRWYAHGGGPIGEKQKFAIKVRQKYARLHQINAQQWGKQMEHLDAFSKKLEAALAPPPVYDLVVERALEGLKTVPRIVQAEHEQKVMQHIANASRVVVRSSSPRDNGLGGGASQDAASMGSSIGPVIVLLIHLPAGTKVSVTINGRDRELQTSIEQTLAELEAAETIRVPGIVCPSAGHVVVMRRGDMGSTSRDVIRGSKRFNIWHSDAVLELVLTLVRKVSPARAYPSNCPPRTAEGAPRFDVTSQSSNHRPGSPNSRRSRSPSPDSMRRSRSRSPQRIPQDSQALMATIPQFDQESGLPLVSCWEEVREMPATSVQLDAAEDLASRGSKGHSSPVLPPINIASLSEADKPLQPPVEEYIEPAMQKREMDDVPHGKRMHRKNTPVEDFRLHRHVCVAQSIIGDSITGSRPMFVFEMDGSSDGAPARLRLAIDLLHSFFDSLIEDEATNNGWLNGGATSYLTPRPPTDPNPKSVDGTAGGGGAGSNRIVDIDVQLHLRNLVAKEKQQLLAKKNETSPRPLSLAGDRAQIEAVGAVYSTQSGRSCYFSRTMKRLRANEKGMKVVGTSGLEEFLEWTQKMRERPPRASPPRRGAGAPAKEQGEDPLRLAQSIATRVKALFPDHLVLVTDSLKPDRWVDALNVHESLRGIPINVIALDANKASLRLLTDLAKRTKGAFRSVSPSEFTK